MTSDVTSSCLAETFLKVASKELAEKYQFCVQSPFENTSCISTIMSSPDSFVLKKNIVPWTETPYLPYQSRCGSLNFSIM
jgi:hypothetical protein